MGLATRCRDVPQAGSLGSRQEPVDDLSHDQRSDNAVLVRLVEQAHEAESGVEQFGVERGDVQPANPVGLAAELGDVTWPTAGIPIDATRYLAGS